jgi:ubiquinone/menaquinone biosynthesis C-methylase UbiE
MGATTERERELAYRFDLFVAPDWSGRFDAVLDEHVEMPTKGRILEINCGTGAHVLAAADRLVEGDVVGSESRPERVAIARAKIAAASDDRCAVVEADPEELGFEDGSFEGVVLDASLSDPSRLGAMTAEALRVAKRGAPVAVKVTLRGSFDEFFSVYWEALHDVGLDDEVWSRLEAVITRRPTEADAVATIKGAGLHDAKAHRSKEEWRFETGAAFLDAPFLVDLFLDEWFDVVPAERRDEVRAAVERIIDREAVGLYFAASAYTAVIAGVR